MKKIITARKRSLGQGDIYRLQTKLQKGNVFHKRVSRILSTGAWGVYTRLDRHPAPWADPPGQTPPPPPPPPHPPDRHHTGRWLLQPTVHILLKCILVSQASVCSQGEGSPCLPDRDPPGQRPPLAR